MRALLLSALFLFGFTQAHANVVITGTRVVYPAQQKEVTVQLDNVGKSPSLVQAWIDNGNDQAAPGQTPVPFVLTPPIFRMDAGKGQTLRLLYTQEALPQDRESVFYLNVLDIPPKPAADSANAPTNFLQLSIRSRLKLFFRPQGLKPAVEAAPQALKLSLAGNNIQIQNPTPYYITVSEIELFKGAQSFKLNQVPMLAPFGQAEAAIASPPYRNGISKAIVRTINDYGGISQTELALP